MSTQRNILAAILIFGIFMLIPQYMEMVGVIPEEVSIDDAGPQTVSQKEPQTDIYSAVPVDSEKKPLRSLEASEILTIITPLYKAKVSNHGGGSIVYYEIREGEKVRTQFFKGVVIQIKGTGRTKTFTIRKISGTVGVERIFPFNLPTIQKIEVNSRGKVRRSRIFYFRELRGKKARIKERKN